MALTDVVIRKAQVRKTRYLLCDGEGLNLEIMTTGPKIWRLRCFRRSITRLCPYPKLGVNVTMNKVNVDATLNNYVALHYASRHMSWLHCMWGVGASAGPCIMSAALTGGPPWNGGLLVSSDCFRPGCKRFPDAQN